MQKVILVTRSEYEKGLTIFENQRICRAQILPAPESEVRLAAEVRRKKTEAVIVGVDNYRSELYEALGPGSIIARFGAGHDGIDKKKATAKGVLITNTPGALTISVAEHTIWLIGTLVRHITTLDKETKKGNWKSMTGLEMRGKTLAVIGFGQIGREVSRIAGIGLGMRVIAFDCIKKKRLLKIFGMKWKRLKAFFGIENYTTSIESALRNADVVSIHLSFNAYTKHYFNRRRLFMLKQGVYLINTSRGAIIDERALFDALVKDKIAGAALDVFEREPYTPVALNHRLSKLPNIIMTPHVGSNTDVANHRMAEMALKNIAYAFERKWNKLNLVNFKVIEKLRRCTYE